MHLLPDADGMLARKPNRRQLPIHFCRRHRTAAAREPGPHYSLATSRCCRCTRKISRNASATTIAASRYSVARSWNPATQPAQRPGQAQRQIKKRRVGAEGGSLILLFNLFYRLNPLKAGKTSETRTE